MSTGDNKISLGPVQIVCETDGAYLIKYELEDFWIPKSQIVLPAEKMFSGDIDNITINRVFAEEQGLL